MLQTTVRVTLRPRPWRLLAWFLAALALVWLSGRVYEARTLGRTDEAGRQLIADSVRQEFNRLSSSLDAAAAAAARQRDLMLRAPADQAAARELFAALASADRAQVAVTVYATDGSPLAWSGRPSELPGARINGPAALLVAPGSSGLRLVLVHPVDAPDGGAGRHAGIVLAEVPLPTSRSPRGLGAEALTWVGAAVPVTLRPGYEGGGESRSPEAFVLADLDGRALLEGSIRIGDVAAARLTVRARTMAALVALTALFIAWLSVPVIAWQRRARTPEAVAARSAVLAALVVGARAVAWAAVPLAGAEAPLSGAQSVSAQALWWLRSPADFLLTSAACLAGVMIVGDIVTRLRIGLRRTRVSPAGGWAGALAFGLAHVAAGMASAALLAWYLGRGTLLSGIAGIDWLRYSLSPWDAARLAVAAGLVCMHASAVWAAAAVLRFAAGWWRVRPAGPEPFGVRVAWIFPVLFWVVVPGALDAAYPGWVLVPPALLAVALARGTARFLRWRRHSSQASALVALFLALALPAVTFYPAAVAQADRTKRRVVETRLAPQAMQQRDEVQARVRRAMTQVDAVPGLTDLVRSQEPPAAGQVPTEYAFLVWSQTDLATYRLTSAIELYGEGGAITSRFALNLPEYTQAQQRWQEAGCGWEVFEEVSPFGSEERRLLHAGRGLCVEEDGRTRMVGTVVIHAMLDYGSLPFITSQNPYVELFRTPVTFDEETRLGRDVEFVVYGWSLRPIYASGLTTWTLDAGTFRRVYASRTPFWTRQDASGRRDHVYLANDRGGIYALGYPAISPVGHLVSLAELVTLAGAVFVLLMLLRSAGMAAAGVGGERGRDLLHEIRASFYRKLFLAFVAVAVIPVITLAFVARAYMMDRLQADVEEAAIRTTTVARRFVEDSSRIQERGEGAAITLNDDAIVGISRVIDQDVNVYDGARLVATSERDLFASGLLPTRTSADVYRAIVLDRRATFVGEERSGRYPYMVAAAPLKIAGLNGLITVPMTLRQRAIDREFDDLNRRILLGVLAFILIGSALGYWMAERIADPVNRLQRATARGRAAAARRGLQQHGGRTAAPAGRPRTHAPPRGVGRHGEAGRARNQEPADARAAVGRAPAPRARGSRQAAVARARRMRGLHPRPGAPASSDRRRVLELRLVADAEARGHQPGRAGGGGGRALPGGNARRHVPRGRRPPRPAALRRRPQPRGPRAHEHDRERAPRHAARRVAADRRAALGRRARDPAGDPGHGGRDGPRLARSDLRTLLLDEGRRHGTRPHHRQAEHRDSRRDDRGGQQPGARHDGAGGDPANRPGRRPGGVRLTAARPGAGTAPTRRRRAPSACRGTRARAGRCAGGAG
ncbi:MAG: kinE 2 [Acidobacteria bacterium]|nr:kinE 2 [Acidobacteriota bacterium]